jgi:hypothetical protein
MSNEGFGSKLATRLRKADGAQCVEIWNDWTYSLSPDYLVDGRVYMARLPGLPPLEVRIEGNTGTLIVWDETVHGSSVVGEVKVQ